MLYKILITKLFWTDVDPDSKQELIRICEVNSKINRNIMKWKALLTAIIIFITGLTSIYFYSCSNAGNILIDIIENEVTAKERLDSANAQAKRDYGNDSKLVLIFGRNVNGSGKTDISGITAFTNPDSLGAWLYVFKGSSDTSLRVYTPNPTPGARNCINLTSFFDIYSILGLIPDTSAANIVRGALNLIISANVSISTQFNVLIDSDAALNLSNSATQIIQFNSNFTPSISTTNGNIFMQTGTDKSVNMFLIPAAGTLNLPQFIQELFGFPSDVWIVNYKKKNAQGQTENLVLATVVEANQTMGLQGFPNFSTKVVNISKFFSGN
jgi:hypothetical protein